MPPPHTHTPNGDFAYGTCCSSTFLKTTQLVCMCVAVQVVLSWKGLLVFSSGCFAGRSWIALSVLTPCPALRLSFCSSAHFLPNHHLGVCNTRMHNQKKTRCRHIIDQEDVHDCVRLWEVCSRRLGLENQSSAAPIPSHWHLLFCFPLLIFLLARLQQITADIWRLHFTRSCCLSSRPRKPAHAPAFSRAWRRLALSPSTEWSSYF